MSTVTTPTIASGTWAVEPAHSEVGFTVRHLGLSKVRGRAQNDLRLHCRQPGPPGRQPDHQRHDHHQPQRLRH